MDVAIDGVEGLKKFKKGKYDLVLCDILMPNMLGLEVLKGIRKLKPDQRFIMMTAVKDDEMVKKVTKEGCYMYITKPVKLKKLDACVTECFPETFKKGKLKRSAKSKKLS